MRVHLCGVRGSTPSSGPGLDGVGGHTSCVALAHDDGPWSLLLDGGTGLSRVTAMLDGGPFRGTILLGHLHLDHTQGLPFFRAGDRDDASVHVIVPEQGVDPFELLCRCYSPPHFPITLADLLGRWTFGTIGAGGHRIEGFDVVAADVVHPGGRTMGYRISDGRSSVVYVSDHGPDGSRGSLDGVVELAAGADVLIHDSHFTDAEQVVLAEWGHSTPGVALEIAERAGVGQLVLFHHAPGRSDVDVEAMASALRPRTVEVVVGREGLTLTPGGGRRDGPTPGGR